MNRIAGLYAILDPRFCGPTEPVPLARALLAGGCRLMQLRVKAMHDPTATACQRLDLARALMALKREYDFCLIINDDIGLAKELRADGVHLGAHDLPLAEARALLGPSAIIGYSSHSLPEAVAAQQAGANYVAFGAIFPSRTKGPGHPIQGLTRLTEVLHALSIPVVAIGGITRDNVDATWHTGTAAVAMITGLAHALDPRTEASWFIQRLQRI